MKKLFRKFELNKKNLRKNLTNKLNKSNGYSEEISISTSGKSIVHRVIKFPNPIGICSNPISDELKETIEQDKLCQLLNNTIDSCIFYNKFNGYCYYDGSCKNKCPMPEDKKIVIYKMRKK